MSAYIKPGIQIVRISEVSKDDEGNVNFSFTQGEEVDALAALQGEGDFGGADTGNVRIFALKKENYGTEITGFRLVEHINDFRSFYEQILLAYFPKSEVKWASLYEGVEVTSIEDVKNFSAGDVTRVGNNITNYFLEKMKDADLTKEVRIKFYRQSEEKTFITLKPEMGMGYMGKKDDLTKLRSGFVVPFIEDAVIPANASKLKYSNYEKGLDKDGNRRSWDKSSAEPIQADSAPVATPTGTSGLPF